MVYRSSVVETKDYSKAKADNVLQLIQVDAATGMCMDGRVPEKSSDEEWKECERPWEWQDAEDRG